MISDNTRIKIPLSTFSKTSQHHMTNGVIINDHAKVFGELGRNEPTKVK